MNAQLVAIIIMCLGITNVIVVAGLLLSYSRPNSQLSLAQTLGLIAVVCFAFVLTSVVLIQTR